MSAYESSFDLANQLKELSGWEFDQVQGYSCGFLLRKLPLLTYIYGIHDLGGDVWVAETPHMLQINEQRADTPEDAFCQVAIDLFKQGILTK